jgi:hypothetical protein
MDANSMIALGFWMLFVGCCLLVAAGLAVLVLDWVMQPLEEPADDMMAVAEQVAESRRNPDWTVELADAYDRYRAGEDVTVGARRELP